jgi:hypothetical protein
MGYVPDIPWATVAGRVQRHWDPLESNPHKAIFAQSRGGKSFMIRRGLLPLVPLARQVVIDVKPGGDPTWNGWGADVTELAPGFGDNDNGDAYYRIRLLPGDEGEGQVRRILDQLAAEGECVIVMDDARKITDPRAPGLKCGMVVDHLLLEGAALGISVILGANSAAWATSSLRDQCGTIFLGHLGGEARDDCAKLAGLGKAARAELDTIAPKRFLYVDAHDGEPLLARTALAA